MIPRLGRSPGEGKGYPLQYSGLKNFMDCIVHGVAKSWTRLSDFHYILVCICSGEEKSNPPQYSCLENPVDRGAWWAAVYGGRQSQT